MADPNATRVHDMPRAGSRVPGVLSWVRMVQAQSTIEYAVLLAAVVAAIIVMSDYIRRAMNAHGNSVEEQLNGAVLDNSPGVIPP